MSKNPKFDLLHRVFVSNMTFKFDKWPWEIFFFSCHKVDIFWKFTEIWVEIPEYIAPRSVKVMQTDGERQGKTYIELRAATDKLLW